MSIALGRCTLPGRRHEAAERSQRPRQRITLSILSAITATAITAQARVSHTKKDERQGPEEDGDVKGTTVERGGNPGERRGRGGQNSRDNGDEGRVDARHPGHARVNRVRRPRAEVAAKGDGDGGHRYSQPRLEREDDRKSQHAHDDKRSSGAPANDSPERDGPVRLHGSPIGNGRRKRAGRTRPANPPRADRMRPKRKGGATQAARCGCREPPPHPRRPPRHVRSPR